LSTSAFSFSDVASLVRRIRHIRAQVVINIEAKTPSAQHISQIGRLIIDLSSLSALRDDVLLGKMLVKYWESEVSKPALFVLNSILSDELTGLIGSCWITGAGSVFGLTGSCWITGAGSVFGLTGSVCITGAGSDSGFIGSGSITGVG
jgi:hypothetical protein